MAYRSLQDISPWDQQSFTFDFAHSRKQSKSFTAKHRSIIFQGRKVSQIYSQIHPRSKTIPRSFQSCKDINIVKLERIPQKHSSFVSGGQCIRMKTNTNQQSNYSEFMGAGCFEQVGPFCSDFTVKKHSRMKNFQKSANKQQKIKQIFRKMYDIQNPVQRKNLNLPRIQVKM